MQNLINTIVKYKELITLTALIVISLSLISTGNVSKIGGFRTVVVAAIARTQSAFSWIPNPASMKNENKALRELNTKLSSEVIRMRDAKFENERLRQMLALKNNSEYELEAAEVAGKSTVEMRNYLTINKGLSYGIRRGMAVRTDAGLAGLVVASTDNYALVEMLTNRNVRVSGKIQATGIDGILFWQGGNIFYLDKVPEIHQIEKGQLLVTSNLSNKFPPNIPIGEVEQVKRDPTSLFLKILIKPFVNFSSISEVFVIKEVPDPERLKLIKEIELRQKSRKE